MNGRFFTDKNIGGLTCFENNGCSTVDYLIATYESSKLLSDFNLGKKCVFMLHTLVKEQMKRRKPLYVAFVDLTKAFDYIHRNALYFKSKNANVGGNFIQTIISMFNTSKCRIKWINNVSKLMDSEYGVLQGGMISLQLFNEYVKDLRNQLIKSLGVTLGNQIISHLFFADDLIIISDSPEGLQKQLDLLHSYNQKWHLIASIEKNKSNDF